MGEQLKELKIKNYRCWPNLEFEARPINVLFGPNGAGKSTFLDVLWFLQECLRDGVSSAASSRSHGIGMLWQRSECPEFSVELRTDSFVYRLLVEFAGGSINPLAEEALVSNVGGQTLFKRASGESQIEISSKDREGYLRLELPDPEDVALDCYVAFRDRDLNVLGFQRLIRFAGHYSCRSFNLQALRTIGSETGPEMQLRNRAENLWSILRNLHDQSRVDGRYDLIMGLMRKAFPHFRDLTFQQTGLNSVYAEVLDNRFEKPMRASGISDGHLQQLILLTALFAQHPEQDKILLFDEPELSLHPHALAVFAEAVREATSNWNRQVFIATHSPVLLSQFDPDCILAVEQDEHGISRMQRLSEMSEISDLLEEYAAGSLYMAEAVARQSAPANTPNGGKM